MKSRSITLTLCSALVFWGWPQQAALAQAWNPLWALGMGSSLLYPLRRTIGMPYIGGPYNANPLYSANSFFRVGGVPNIFPFTNASYGPWGYRNAGMLPGYFTNNTVTSQYQNRAQDEPDSADPSANTMNSINPYQPPPPAYTAPPAAVPSSGGAPPLQAGTPYGQPFSAPPSYPAPVSAAPPVAPPIKSGAPYAVPPATSSMTSPAVPASVVSATSPAVSPAAAASAGAMGRPLAEGFINHLNSNYQGDMSRALGNSDTRSWARAMGVIGDDVQDGSHLSSDRLEVLGKVLKDNSLDPVSKLDTMRILLKKSTPAVK